MCRVLPRRRVAVIAVPSLPWPPCCCRHRLISSRKSLFAPLLHLSPVEAVDTSALGMKERLLQLLEAALSSMHSTRADPHCQLRTQSRMLWRAPLTTSYRGSSDTGGEVYRIPDTGYRERSPLTGSISDYPPYGGQTALPQWSGQRGV